MKTSTTPAVRDPGRLLGVAELAVTAVTVAGVLGLARLFVDGTFFFPVLAVAIVAHGLAVVLRRRQVTGGLTALAAVAGFALVASWFFLPETTSYGLPGPATLSSAREELSLAWATFTSVVAPAPVELGFVLASAAAVWFVAFVADTAAFRAGSSLEAAVPGATLFVFGAALGAERFRVLSTAVFVAAVLAHWLASRALGQAANPTWLANSRAGSSALLQRGATVGLGVVLVAALLGPLVPGAEARALLPWRARDRDDETRVTVSPFVDIRTRIVDQADVEVFRVEADRRSYWRLTSLDTFDGRTWSPSGASYGNAKGPLEADVGPSATGIRSEQRFEIVGLASDWLPAAYRPVAVDGAEANWDEASGSLLFGEDPTEPGLAYRVTSNLAVIEPGELAAPAADVPSEVAKDYTVLPDGFSPEVTALAQSLVEEATSPFEQARRLQDHFRSEIYTYDTNVAPGHGEDALSTFLFDTRRGYCEQFSGAYAAMARSIGLPARVAVGFTPGELEADGPLPRARAPWSRLARGLPLRLRLGGIRTHAGPRHPRRRGLHRPAGAAGDAERAGRHPDHHGADDDRARGYDAAERRHRRTDAPGVRRGREL